MSVGEGEFLGLRPGETEPVGERIGGLGHIDHLCRGIHAHELGLRETLSDDAEKGAGTAADVEDACRVGREACGHVHHASVDRPKEDPLGPAAVVRGGPPVEVLDVATVATVGSVAFAESGSHLQARPCSESTTTVSTRIAPRTEFPTTISSARSSSSSVSDRSAAPFSRRKSARQMPGSSPSSTGGVTQESPKRAKTFVIAPSVTRPRWLRKSASWQPQARARSRSLSYR